MEWAIINVLQLLKRESTGIIIKVNTRSFKWCIVGFSKMSLDKATR